MRLFGTVNGTIDRKDRAEWLTPIFDLAYTSVSAIYPGDSTFVRSGPGDATFVRSGPGDTTIVPKTQRN